VSVPCRGISELIEKRLIELEGENGSILKKLEELERDIEQEIQINTR
jgi:hypothetical protein